MQPHACASTYACVHMSSTIASLLPMLTFVCSVSAFAFLAAKDMQAYANSGVNYTRKEESTSYCKVGVVSREEFEHQRGDCTAGSGGSSSRKTSRVPPLDDELQFDLDGCEETKTSLLSQHHVKDSTADKMKGRVPVGSAAGRPFQPADAKARFYPLPNKPLRSSGKVRRPCVSVLENLYWCSYFCW